MKRIALIFVAALTITACGGTTIKTVPPGPSSPKAPAPAILQPAATCPKGQSFMGCSIGSPARAKLSFGNTPSGRYFPDVSSWQGHPNWSAAKPHIYAAADKLGEYSVDPTVAYNVSEQKRLRILFAVYWFVRPTGCAHEGSQIQQAAQSLGGIHLIVLDLETPGISGYAACLNPYVRAVTGRNADIYTSPGTWPGGSTNGLPIWIAAYGPSVAPSFDGRRPVAFQFTDGRNGYPVYIPGIGMGDVNVDYGMFNAPKPPKPVDPYALFPDAVRQFGASERRTVKTWDKNGCRQPVRRPVCQTGLAYLLLLDGRIRSIESGVRKNPAYLKNLQGRDRQIQRRLRAR